MTAAVGYADLTSLALVVDAIELETLQQGERETTLVRAAGAGRLGYGEDVTHDSSDRAAFRSLDLADLRGRRTLGETVEALGALDLAQTTTHAVVASYRRWAIESALLDLALAQAGLSLGAVLRLPPRPVRFVVSPRGGEIEPIVGLLERGPGLRLKLDPKSSWSRSLIDEIAALDAVEVLDLKGTYPGTAVYQPPDARLYGDLIEAFPAAWIEDPALTAETVGLLEHSRHRIAWDEPVQAPSDLERLEPLAAVNVKPSRLGSLAALLELVARCRRRGVAVYGGGQTEIGPGRGQIQLLAALLYPDGPNDVAPVGYDDLGSNVPLPARPLVAPGSQVGFRWDTAVGDGPHWQR